VNAAVENEIESEAEIWKRFTKTRLPEDREVIVMHYMQFANMMAAKFYSGRHIFEIEFEEYRQYAIVGLMEAIDRFDLQGGASFKTFSAHRIRGAILNGIEKFSEMQQQISARTRIREERLASLCDEVPENQQDPFMRLVNTAIGVAIGYMLEDTTIYQENESSYEHNVYRSRELDDIINLLRDLLKTLPQQENTVITYHYLQGMRFEEIAITMALTRGRISQIHRKALQRMRDNMDRLRLKRSDY
jgi:RNA polymerase sigma factor FliA